VLAAVVVFFVLGVLGAIFASYKLNLVPGTSSAQLSAQVGRATDALMHQRWDAPPGDNVRDLTSDGLTRWPNDPQLLHIRALACDDIVKLVRAKQAAGEGGEALRLAQIAAELDPTDVGAKMLVATLQYDGTQGGTAAADSVAPLATLRAGGAGTPVAAVARAAVDASNAKPGVAQPVDFVGRIAGAPSGAKAKVEAARFHISGPGLGAGIDLAGMSEGASGPWHATYAFLEAGRYEVVFGAKVDGQPVRASRSVAVGSPAPLPTSAPSSEPNVAPAPSASAKWM
jgi:serine/threonine-protein kinase